MLPTIREYVICFLTVARNDPHVSTEDAERIAAVIRWLANMSDEAFENMPIGKLIGACPLPHFRITDKFKVVVKTPN